MPTDDMTQIISTLLTAPSDAVVNAAAKQRRIWITWLRDIKRLVENTEDADIKKSILQQHLALAPTWKMSAQLSLGVTMRISSVERNSGEGSLSFGAGLLQASGSFGFLNETSTESVLQARANYALTNDNEIAIEDYLNSLGVDAFDPAQLDTAINKLGSAAIRIAPETPEDEGYLAIIDPSKTRHTYPFGRKNSKRLML